LRLLVKHSMEFPG